MKSTAFSYYFHSIVSLFREVKHPSSLLRLMMAGPTETPLQIELRSGERFYVQGLLDVWVIKETFLDKWYERASLVLQPGWTIIDIGAALGDYSVWAAKQLTHGRLIAVEPFPTSVALLQMNLSANHVENVEVVARAVTGSAGQARIKPFEGSAAKNSTAMGGSAEGTLDVTAISLRDLLDECGITTCDYLKLDCEGGEYEILFNLPAEVFARLPRICMEVHDGITKYTHQELQAFLEANGYLTRLTPNPVHADLAFLYAWREGVD